MATNLLERANVLLMDRYATVKQRDASDKIVIVAIDEHSLVDIGAWPWSRKLHGQVIEKISRQNPNAIGLDLFLSEASDDSSDKYLAQAIQRSGKLVLPFSTLPKTHYLQNYPLPGFASAAKGVGHVNLLVDFDGAVRSIGPTVQADSRQWHQLTTLMLGMAENPKFTVDGALSSNRDDKEWIPYAGPAGHFHTVSYTDVLNGRIADDEFKGKWVLVGATASGMGDKHLVPFGTRRITMPGVEVLANRLDAQLTGQNIHPAPTLVNAILNGIVLCISLCIFAFARVNSKRFWAAVIWTAAVFGAGFLIASYADLLIAPAAGMVVTWVAYFLVIVQQLRKLTHQVTAQIRRLNISRRGYQDSYKNSIQSSIEYYDVETATLSLEQAVDRMRDAHQFVADVLQSLPDASLVVDLHASITMVNAAATHRFSDSGASLVGWPIQEVMKSIRTIEGDPIPMDVSSLRQKPNFTLECLDHQDAYLVVKVAPFNDAAGQQKGWIVTISNLTQMREAERLREEAMQFISHDMRSPQASIITMIDLHRMSGGGPMQADQINKIEDYAQRSLDLCSGYIQLAKARETKLDCLDEVDLCELIDACLEEVQPIAIANKVTVQPQHQYIEAFVECDPLLLGGAIVNLLGNAIKFSPSNSNVSVNLRQSGNAWRIEVSDHGIGIAYALQGQLFQRFRTVRHEHKIGHSAIGLGLEFVRVVAQRHRGGVGLKSVPGEGSCFYIDIPMQVELSTVP